MQVDEQEHGAEHVERAEQEIRVGRASHFAPRVPAY
jgi:hypothetical protein